MNEYKDYNTHICLHCEKRLEAGQLCDCEDDKITIYGNDISIDEDGNIVCKCGNAGFKMSMHLNMSPRFYKSYTCSKCGNPVGKETILSQVLY